MTPTTIARIITATAERVEFINSAGTRITAVVPTNASARNAARLMLHDRKIGADEIKETLLHATGYLYRDGAISAVMSQPWSEFQAWIAREAIRLKVPA